MNQHERSAPPAQTAVTTTTTRPARAAAGMKKFSKLFSLLGRGRAADTSEWDSASTRESSPDVHQLTSKRRRGQGAIKSPARNGLSRIVADEKNLPCLACAAINFPKLLNWTPGQPRPWIPLAHTLSGDSECPYCIFFQALVGGSPDQTRKFTPYLRIRQAFERLGVGEKHELGSAVLLEVSTKSKALPWGYIVKAVEGEDDIAGYRETTPMIRGRVVTPLLDPVLPRTWIDFCLVNHSFAGCGSRGPAIRGLKLIDCREEEIIFVDDLMAEAVEYVTLSYAGGKGEEETNGHSPHSPQHHGLPKILPPLITDAIAVTKSLGFRYLWVDRYCFPQFNAVERQRQLGLMGDIFSRSALTLIVAAGEGVQDAIPGVSVPREEQLSLQTEAGFFTTSLTRPDAEVASSKWATRGWTFQEGVFARRRLVFTPSQTYFQCQSLHCHESICYTLKTKPTLNLGRVFPLNGAGTHSGEFKSQINDYISRDVTSLDERLDAFRGVLDRYEKMDPPVENILGLPLYHSRDFKNVPPATRTDRLVVGLGWRAGQTTDDPNYVFPMYLSDVFPSWTWAAWRLRPEHSDHDPLFQIYEVGDNAPLLDNVTAVPGLEISVGFEDHTVVPWTDADYIKANPNSMSFLRIKTYCFDIHLRRDDEGNTNMLEPDLQDPYRNVVASCLLRASTTDLSAEPPAGDHDLVGVAISGRDFKGGNDSFSFDSVNVLICGWKNWEVGGQLVRLGTIEFLGGGIEHGMLKGVLNAEKRLDAQIREVDIY